MVFKVLKMSRDTAFVHVAHARKKSNLLILEIWTVQIQVK